MRVVVIVRTRDSEQFIEEFCSSYLCAYRIIVADGGSKDNTIKLAKQFSNVRVTRFDERIYNSDRTAWKNHPSMHINHLIMEAHRVRKINWIVFDDVDCVPNREIQDNFLDIFQEADEKKKYFIYACRMYIYKREKYFKDLSMPGGNFSPALWAWKPNMMFFAKLSESVHHNFSWIPKEEEILKLMPPKALLHYFYPSEEYMDAKVKFYKELEEPLTRNPKEFGGAMLDLEDWMV